MDFSFEIGVRLLSFSIVLHDFLRSEITVILLSFLLPAEHLILDLLTELLFINLVLLSFDDNFFNYSTKLNFLKMIVAFRKSFLAPPLHHAKLDFLFPEINFLKRDQ